LEKSEHALEVRNGFRAMKWGDHFFPNDLFKFKAPIIISGSDSEALRTQSNLMRQNVTITK
jgi:hypothetical protein